MRSLRCVRAAPAMATTLHDYVIVAITNRQLTKFLNRQLLQTNQTRLRALQSPRP